MNVYGTLSGLSKRRQEEGSYFPFCQSHPLLFPSSMNGWRHKASPARLLKDHVHSPSRFPRYDEQRVQGHKTSARRAG